MRIKTTSLHYKLLRFFYGDQIPKDICSYFWMVLICVVITVTSIIGCLAILTSVGSMLLYGENFKEHDFFTLLTSLLTGTIVVSIVVSIVTGLSILILTSINKKNNLIYQRFLAFKEKRCAKLEFYDPNYKNN